MNFETKGNPELFDIMIRYLSKRFNVVMPKLAIANSNANRGIYSNGRVQHQIRISKNASLWVLAHEHLHHMKDIRDSQKLPHGRSFYDLLRIVARSIGDERDYPWAREYRQIYRWAKADGLAVPKEWERLQAETAVAAAMTSNKLLTSL